MKKCRGCGYINVTQTPDANPEAQCPACKKSYTESDLLYSKAKGETVTQKRCIKCNHVLRPDDPAARDGCPNCGFLFSRSKSVIAEDAQIVAARAARVDREVAIARQARREREEAAKKEASKVVCKQCGSDQLSSNTKGIAIGRALIAGGALAGFGLLAAGTGLLTGVAGRNKVRITCLKCGHHWIAGS